MNTALVVEADRALRRRLICLLGRQGWTVNAVGSLEEARDRLEQPAAQVVYINEAIDDDCGYLLLFAIRAHPAWRFTRVVMAGRGDPDQQSLWAAELGADAYLALPCATELALAKLALVPSPPAPRAASPLAWLG